MGMHSNWKAAKAKAKTLNKNAAFKFPTDMKLGAALDKMEAAEKVYKAAAAKELDAAWAKAADAYFQASKVVGTAAKTYMLALPKMKITPEARALLDSQLTMGILGKATKTMDESRRLESRLAKVRRK